MKQKQTAYRPAIGLLLAAIAFPASPLLAQDPPVTTSTPPSITDALPPIVVPAPVATTPQPVPLIRPPVTTQPVTQHELTTPPVAETPTVARRPVRATRMATRPRAEAPVPQAAPVEPASVQTAAPVAEAPLVEATPPDAVPAEGVAPSTPANAPAIARLWPLLLVGIVLLIGAVGLLLRRRRRTNSETFDAVVDPAAPMIVPISSTPLAYAATKAAAEQVASVEDVSVGEPDRADVEMLSAASDPPAGRPWIEFLMRPVRAGMKEDEAVVEFELTVGNTGSVPARDVRISTWMFAAGSTQDSEMERMLIDPPAEASISEVDIAAGDGARVDAAMTLSKAGLSDAVLPVVAADARYRLPDGSEGRTSVSFAIGVPDGEGMAYFSVENPSGLHEDVEARLHGELQRT